MGRYGDPNHKRVLYYTTKPLFFISLLEEIASPFKGLAL